MLEFCPRGNGSQSEAPIQSWASPRGIYYGDTITKLRTTESVLSVVDYFTPRDLDDLNYNDLDMGSGG